MNRLRKYRILLCSILFLDLVAIGLIFYVKVAGMVPDSIFTVVGEMDEVDFSLPIEISESVEALNIKNTDSGFRMNSKTEGSYDVEVRLFGLISLKKMNVKVISQQKVAPCGETAGIYVKSDGLLVLGTDAVEGTNGFRYEPVHNIVKPGDYIKEWNGETVTRISQLKKMIEKNGDKESRLMIIRDGERITVAVTPVKGLDGKYKLGVWVREDTQGIGTITYLAQDGTFGALGHGITDVDTGKLMESCQGELYTAEILNIVKGTKGKPGELEGMINMSFSETIGVLKKNTPLGIFGEVDEQYSNLLADQYMPIALKQEIKKGKAVIRTRINGKKRDYEIEIEEIDMTSSDNKGMVIHVTDKKLLDRTGGIVQGMSGSPILQGGKVIGAVTHVLVDDSTRGYGIFIENMLSAAQ